MNAHNISKEKLDFLFVEYNYDKHLNLIIENIFQKCMWALSDHLLDPSI